MTLLHCIDSDQSVARLVKADCLVALWQVYEHLQIKAANAPVPNNKGGSYLTMFSQGGLIFGIINIIGRPTSRPY